MKPSHLTTPRTLDECHFDPRGQAFHLYRDRPSMDRADVIAMAFSAAAIIALIGFALAGWL